MPDPKDTEEGEFGKMIRTGKLKMLANPPPIPLAGGIASGLRTAAGVAAPTVARKGKEIVEAITKAAKEPAQKTPRQRNAERGGAKEVAKKIPKQGSSTAAPRGLNAGAKRLQGKLEKWRQEGAKTRNQSKPTRRADEGTTAGRVRDAAKRERTPREREQFGPLVPRRDNVPATQGSRAVTTQSGGQRAVAVREAGRRDMVPYKAQSRSVATRTFGDKGQGRITPRPSATGRIAGVAPGASVAASMATRNAPDLRASPAEADRRESKGQKPRTGGDVPRRAETKADKFRKKQQGMKTPGSPTYSPKANKKAVDKSRVSGKRNEAKKFSNFERMKQRQYEKEGFAGRSMTTKRAKDRVTKERKYKFSDFFK